MGFLEGGLYGYLWLLDASNRLYGTLCCTIQISGVGGLVKNL